MKIKDNVKKYMKIIKEKIISLYSSRDTAGYAAVATTTAAIILLAIVSVAIISNITGSDDSSANHTETSLSDMVMAEATSEPVTSQAPSTEAATETTTEPETSTEPETNTETGTAPVAPLETIAIADLDIGRNEDSTEKYIDKGAMAKEFDSNPVAVTKPTSAAPIQPTPASSAINKNTRIVKGIDISKWNSNPSINWSQVKASGVEFVIIRAGYRSQIGTSMYEDSRFREHIEGALAANLQVGVYFYSQATTEKEALEEASYLLSLIKGYNITYPVCFDWEPVPGSRAANANLSKSKATAIAKKFLSTVEAYGYDAMLYSYHSAIEDYFDMTQLSHYKTWVAWYYDEYKNTGRQYQVGELPPAESYPYQMWQYSSTGTVPGINGDVDLNVAFFTYSEDGTASSTIEFELPSEAYTTNKGTPVDFITGTKAFNSAGFDMSSSMTTAISDINGNTISETDAFNNPGIYTITYTLKDFTGLSKKATATLTVFANLIIQLTEKELTFHVQDSTYDDIVNAVSSNLISVMDDSGNSFNLSDMNITGLDDCYNDASTDTYTLIPGTYSITYAISDSIGSTTIETITITIVDEEETTSEPEASTDETTSDNESSFDNETTSGEDTTSNDESTSEKLSSSEVLLFE